MKASVLSLILMSCSVMIVTQTVTAASPTKTVSVSSMVLRRADLPHGYKQTAGTWVTNAQTVKDDHSREYITHGRITGYKTAFSNPEAIALTQVTDVAASFKNAAGARWAVRKAGNTGSASTFAGRHLRPMAVKGIGDEAVGFTVTAKTQGISITLDSIVFRVGKYDGSITGAGVTQSFRLSKLTSLANVMVRRMRAG